MITISETPGGFELVSAHFRHTFADRDKAMLTARVLAVQLAAETGKELQILVPTSWSASIAPAGAALNCCATSAACFR